MEDRILAWLENFVAFLDHVSRRARRLRPVALRLGAVLGRTPELARAALSEARAVALQARRDLDEDFRWAGRLLAAIRTQGRLLFRELSARAPRPACGSLPVVLGACLFLAFWLEFLLLTAILPDQKDAPALACVPAPARDLDPAYLSNLESLLAEFLCFPTPRPNVTPLAPRAGDLLAQDEDSHPPPAVAQDSFPHPLLTLLDLGPAARHSGFRPLPQLPAVRLAVRRNVVRMPVDPKAFHPLDKEALLAAAGDYLGRVFAMVESTPSAPACTALAAAGAPRPLRLAALAPRLLIRPSGRLSALFESGDHGVRAIGWDTRGGTSYGKYQMSSRMGTLDRFIVFLHERTPQWAQRLAAAGDGDTGGVLGSMPREWKRIAAEDPVRFERLQDSFIHSQYYSPTVLAISAETGLDVNAHPAVMREVLWSTAVLHGPTGGAEIFIEAARRVRGQPGRCYNRALLEEVFRERERRIVRSGNPKEDVLRRRLEMEKELALAMLGGTAAFQAQVADRL